LKIVIGAFASALFVALALVQFASDALYAGAAASGTVPQRISRSFGETVYRFLDRLAPAPYVESTLARDALSQGDFDAAQRYALRLPASTVRDGLLARIAGAQNRPQLALEYALAAFDGTTVDEIAEQRAVRDPASAYALEAMLERRLRQRGTHPDAVAQARWQMGLFANRTAWRQVPGSAAQQWWLRVALSDFDAAAALAPLSERYLIADANQADLLQEPVRAERLFQHAAQTDPGSADAVAGLGVIAFENGDRTAAQAYLARAAALDPRSLMVLALRRKLR
jgi:tetratricopeptide (TPR) repeat protein